MEKKSSGKLAQISIDYRTTFMVLPTDDKGRVRLPKKEEYARFGIPDNVIELRLL